MTDDHRGPTPRSTAALTPRRDPATLAAEGFRTIPAQTGVAVELAPGEVLTIVDPEGEQVSDLFLYARPDSAETFSSGRTIDYANSLYISVGDLLYSNRSRVMATVVEDSVGVHDMTLTPCSQETFDILYPQLGGAPHPSCFANIVGVVAPYGLGPDTVGTTLNVFMDVWTDREGELHIDPPPTRPGDVFAIRAEMPLLVAITACSAEKSNNGRCKPIGYLVSRAPVTG
ncbi:DUF1989 domain-containing protein [Actinomycetota bacterium]